MQGGGSNRDGSASTMPAAPAAIAAGDRQSPFHVEAAGKELAGAASTAYERSPATADLAPAIRIGRYGVLRELGRGGMGVTYIAYDEELDRKVALKLVRAEALGEESQKRLRREAQALARLAHPNIVAVHDVGLHHGQAFIAMEFVRGETVAGWLSVRSPRAWTEVLSVLCQAGEGLCAAHAAGLVHRDIKPANIIVGDDGRVRVLDFGLARQELCDSENDEAAEAIAVGMNEPLTYTGALVGTLGYMAPEQLDGSVADARSDQFAFCVSLFEALYGHQPFSGASPRVRLAAIRQGKIADVTGKSTVPRWLHAVIVRGLAFRPDARWPSMDALLAELNHDPARIRRRRLTMGAVGAGLAAMAATLVVGVFVAEDRQAEVCSGARAQIDEVWSPEQRAAIERTMLASGVAYARDTWERTSAVLDRYAADWAAAHTDACEATAVRQEQSEEVLDQRMQCLARRRRSLRVLVGELGRIDAAAMERAIDAAGRLPLVASCSDAEYLSSRIEPPGDPAVAVQVEALEAALTRAEQLQDLGRYDEGLTVAQSAFESAAKVEYPPIEAQARLRLGMLQLATAAYQPAEDSLEEAYFIARAMGEHEVALQAATQLVFLLGYHVFRLGDASVWSRHVQAELPWVSAEVEQANSINTLGVLSFLKGKHEEAAEQYRQALAIWKQALGPGHPQVADALDNLGVVLHAQGKYEEASTMHRQSLAIIELTLGAEHPFVAHTLNNLGGALYLQGKHAEAAQPYRRALKIREQTLGADHPLVADPMLGLALTYLDDGHADKALPLAQRAFALLERHDVGPERLVEARFVLARALMATNKDPHQALALARQVRDVLQAASVPLSLIDLAAVEAWLREYDRQHGPHR
jgi:eukaryotic-like serine/threonine-protein kinase